MTEQAPIHAALAAVMQQVRAVGKDERNAQQGFNFRGIDATLNSVGPALRDHGVVVLPRLVDHHAEQVRVGKNENLQQWARVVVEYGFIGPAGDTVTVTVPGEAMDSGDKSHSKAMSVALRTALLQTLALPTQEPDPDQYLPAAPPPPAPADLARDELLAQVNELGMEPRDVAQYYHRTHGVALQNDTDADRVRAFGKHLPSNTELDRPHDHSPEWTTS